MMTHGRSRGFLDQLDAAMRKRPKSLAMVYPGRSLRGGPDIAAVIWDKIEALFAEK
jgi:hypothetical protein